MALKAVGSNPISHPINKSAESFSLGAFIYEYLCKHMMKCDDTKRAVYMPRLTYIAKYDIIFRGEDHPDYLFSELSDG